MCLFNNCIPSVQHIIITMNVLTKRWKQESTRRETSVPFSEKTEGCFARLDLCHSETTLNTDREKLLLKC